VGGGGDLNDQTNGNPESGSGDSHSAAESVCELANNEGSDESTSAKHRNDGTLASGVENEVGGVADGRVVGVFTEATLVVGHLEVTRDLTRGVTEHETTNGGDETEEDSDKGDLLLGSREFIVAGVSSVGQRRRGLLELGSVVRIPLRTLEERHVERM
jgi:hypothetical protein